MRCEPSLQDAISKRGCLPEHVARECFRQILFAMESRHARNMAPCAAGLDDIYLMDVPGLPSYVLQSLQWTKPPIAGATPWVAPEMRLLRNRVIDWFKVDVYSAGVLLLTMLAGAPHADLPATVSPACVVRLRAMLSRDPSSRPTIANLIMDPEWLGVRDAMSGIMPYRELGGIASVDGQSPYSLVVNMCSRGHHGRVVFTTLKALLRHYPDRPSNIPLDGSAALAPAIRPPDYATSSMLYMALRFMQEGNAKHAVCPQCAAYACKVLPRTEEDEKALFAFLDSLRM
jgi:serine/threonine protein kinase